MVKVMKKRRTIIIGLFILMGILFNITIYFDNGGVQDNNFVLSDLRVSLVDKAYASGGGGGYDTYAECCWSVGCTNASNLCYSEYSGNPWMCMSLPCYTRN